MWLCSVFHYYLGPSDLWKIFNGVMVTQWVSHILYSFPILIQFRLDQSHCFPHCLLTLDQALVYPVKADWPCWGFGTLLQPFLLAPLLEWSNLQKTGWWPRAWSKLSPTQATSYSFLGICVAAVWLPKVSVSSEGLRWWKRERELSRQMNYLSFPDLRVLSRETEPMGYISIKNPSLSRACLVAQR